MKKRFKSLLFLAGALIMMCPASNVFATASTGVAINKKNFPDKYFREYVATNFDTDDTKNYLSADEIAAVTSIAITGTAGYVETQSLKGIENFTNLEVLYCCELKLTELDVTKLTKLQTLVCSYNGIKSLDLSKNTVLKELDCNSNRLSALDLSANKDLEVLWCGNNTDLSSLSLTDNSKLKVLRFNNTTISTIVLSHLKDLEVLDCGFTSLKSVPVSNQNQTKLSKLYCYGMKGLTTLSVTGYPELTYIDCSASSLTDLDVSNNAKLTTLLCYGMANYIPLEPIPLSLLRPGEKDSIYDKKKQGKITAIDITGDTALTTIDCSFNELTELDVTACTGLTYLDIASNKFDAYSIGANGALEKFYCEKNAIEELDVSKNTALADLNCNTNQLVFLDLSKNTSLANLDCGKNHLTSLDVTNCRDDIMVSCSENTYEVTLDKYYEYNMLDLPGNGFTQTNEADQKNDAKKAMHNVTKKKTGCTNGLISGYNLIPDLNAKSIQYDYYVGAYNSNASFTFELTFTNPLMVSVVFTDDANEITTTAGSNKNLLSGKTLTYRIIDKYSKDIDGAYLSVDKENCIKIDTNAKTLTALQPTSDGAATIQIWINGRAKATITMEVQQPVERISLDETTKELYTGGTFTLEPTVLPATATNKEVEFKVSDSGILYYNSKTGVFTAKKTGTAVITCTAKDGSNVSATCTVTVKQGVDTLNILNAYGTSINGGTKVLLKDDKYQLVAEVLPAGAADKSVIWKSNNTAVVTVSEKGELEAVGVGTATITCTPVLNESQAKTVTINVYDGDFTVSGIPESYTLEKTKKNPSPTVTLTATSDAPDFKSDMLEWYSEDETIASVGVNTGKVTAVKGGVVNIICAIGNKTVGTCAVTVKQYPTGIAISANQNLIEGQKIQATATFTPVDTTEKNVQWTSTNPSALTIDAQGNMTAVKQGKAYIQCQMSVDGVTVLSNKVAITVIKPIKTITIAPQIGTGKVFVGKTLSLGTTITPADATNKKLTWTSSNNAVATVSGAGVGVVRGLKAGTVIITAAATDGSGVKATYKVTVQQAVEKITLNTNYKVLKRKQSVTLKAKIEPSNASVKKVTWTSSDKKIATVSKTGKVVAKKAGIVTITCKSTDGTNKFATCRIVVGTPVTSVALNKTKITIKRKKTYSLVPTVKPLNATDKGVEWTSSNPKVATVSPSGVVTAVKKGKATITCKAKDGSGKKKTCKVTVK